MIVVIHSNTDKERICQRMLNVPFNRNVSKGDDEDKDSKKGDSVCDALSMK